MSDRDSDSETAQTSNKLGIEQDLSKNNNNIFSYHNRSDRGSSSQHGDGLNDDDSSDIVNHKQSLQSQGQATKQKGNKLSNMLQTDQIIQGKKQEYKNSDHQAFDNIKQSPQKKAKEQDQINQQAKKQEDNELVKQIQTRKLQQDIQQHQRNSKQEIVMNKVEDTNENRQDSQETKITKLPSEQTNNVKQSVTKIQQQKQKTQQNKQQKQSQITDNNQIVINNGDKQQQRQVLQQKQPEPALQLQNNQKQQIKQEIKQQIDAPSKNNEPIQQQLEAKQEQKSIQKLQKKKSSQNEQKQREYKLQLQSQMAQLKNNMKKKTSQKSKDSQKAKLNKTLMPSSNFRQSDFEQTAETRALELKMISTMALEKKKQSYHLLKEWDKRRAQHLALHRNMVEVLQTEVDKRIKSSIENLQIYTTFFREKAKQQQKFISHQIINTKFALQNNAISKNVYLNCTVILNSLTDENAVKCRKINDFVQLIKNDIFRDSIQAHLMQSQRQLLRVREKISSLKASLRKYNAETEQKTSQLALFFNQNAVNLNIDGQKDFFSTQIQFLHKASQQTLCQKKLGQYCLEYLHTAINQEVKRSKVIRDAMVTFCKALQQCYNIETDPAEIQQLSKAEENKLIEQFYSLQEIFDERCLTMFKNNQNIELEKMVTIDMFSDYIKKFDFEGFDCKVVLLKQYNVKYLSSSKSEPKQQPCYLVITADRFIHLFLNKEKTDAFTKPDVSIKATMKNLQLKQVKSQILDMVIKDEKRNSMIISYLWETRNDRTYRVEFAKKDAREEFVDYVNKLRG